MICKQFTLQRGLAPPQEDLERPVWTRVTVDGVLLTNAAEYAGWFQSPCELFVCEQCWASCCAMSNLAMAARLGDWLVFYPPAISDLPEWVLGRSDKSNVLPETLWFTSAVWNRLREECNAVPPAREFPNLRRCELASLWIRQMPLDTLYPPDRDDLPKLKDLLLASDPLPESDALQRIDSIVEWCGQSPNREVTGRLSKLNEFAGTVNTLHLDGQPSPEWRCFTVGDTLGLPVGDGLLLILDEPP